MRKPIDRAKEAAEKFTGAMAEISGHVCAWCRFTYDPVTSMPIRELSDEEYAKVKSHGVCGVCSDRMMVLAKRTTDVVRRFK